MISACGDINSGLKMAFDQMPGVWGCKDKDSRFIYANAEYARIVGIENKLEIIGMTDFDMPCGTVQCADLFRSQDQIVMQQDQHMKVLDIHPFAGKEWKIYIFTKSPLRDEDDNIIGTMFHGQDITCISNIDFGSLVSKISQLAHDSSDEDRINFKIDKDRRDIELTPRQSQVLFFLLRGKTGVQVANILGISVRTFQEHLDLLKQKFRAQNKFELIDKAISNGYLNNIPDSLFSRQLSVALQG